MSRVVNLSLLCMVSEFWFPAWPDVLYCALFPVPWSLANSCFPLESNLLSSSWICWCMPQKSSCHTVSGGECELDAVCLLGVLVNFVRYALLSSLWPVTLNNASDYQANGLYWMDWRANGLVLCLVSTLPLPFRRSVVPFCRSVVPLP